MAKTSTKLFIMEVMGRNTGWLAAACGFAAKTAEQGPHAILVPERDQRLDQWLHHVDNCINRHGYCVTIAAEGSTILKNQTTTSSPKDAFGHGQLAGRVGPQLAQIAQKELGHKTHWALPDYLQRSSGHIRSSIDYQQALALGNAAIHALCQEQNGIMLGLKRFHNKEEVRWGIHYSDLALSANQEKPLPQNFLTADGWHISKRAHDYFKPLLEGEIYPNYKAGLPQYFNSSLLQNAKLKTPQTKTAETVSN